VAIRARGARLRLLAGRQGAGFSTTELVVVCGILGLLASVSVPYFLRYYQSAALQAATEEVAVFLNQGRQVAIKENQPVCVQITSGSLQLRVRGCGGTTWVGPGTDSSGSLKLPQGFTLASNASLVFSYLGAASPAATYTVTNTQDGRTLQVAVSASGRIRIGP
jgi:Tfp pilus assembly protein FimT